MNLHPERGRLVAYADPISEAQVGLCYSLARQGAVVDFEEEADLDRLVKPVYDVDSVWDLNRGQASMLIDDLMSETGNRERQPTDAQSIFE